MFIDLVIYLVKISFYWSRSEEKSEVVEELKEEGILMDLELFAYEDLLDLKKRYNLEFFIFCSTELKTIGDIFNKFKKINNLT